MGLAETIKAAQERKRQRRIDRYSGELLLVKKTTRGILTSEKQELYQLSKQQHNQICAFLRGVLNKIDPPKPKDELVN